MSRSYGLKFGYGIKKNIFSAFIAFFILMLAGPANAGGGLGQPCELIGTSIPYTICFYYYDKGIVLPYGNCDPGLTCYRVLARTIPKIDSKRDDDIFVFHKVGELKEDGDSGVESNNRQSFVVNDGNS